MLERVVETITRYSMFQPGQRVGVAVSGGADSVCLLGVLRELAPGWDLRLTVLHLDHGLRGEESRRDAVFVRELAAAAGLPFELRETDVGAVRRETGENLEQAARAAGEAVGAGAGVASALRLATRRSSRAASSSVKISSDSASGVLPARSAGPIVCAVSQPRGSPAAAASSPGREPKPNRSTAISACSMLEPTAQAVKR